MILIRTLPLMMILGLIGCAVQQNHKEKETPMVERVSPDSRDTEDTRRAREAMVSLQIEARGVKDPRVLQAMRKVERHLYVPERERPLAYTDRPLPIGENQTISQPYIVALMTELLEVQPHHRVLEVGTGSGYQAAVLAELAREVYTIEIVELLGKRAGDLLQSLGYGNIQVRVGDGYRGWPEEAPFDGIMVTAAPEHVPQPLIDQLADGGKLVLPVGGRRQQLRVLTRVGNEIRERDVIDVIFVPMTGEAQKR